MCRDTACLARVAELLSQFVAPGHGVTFDLEKNPKEIDFYIPLGGRSEFVVRFTERSHDRVGLETFSHRVGQAIRAKKKRIEFSVECLADVASRPRAWTGNGREPITSTV